MRARGAGARLGGEATANMELHITTPEEAQKFLAGHQRGATIGPVAVCSCGWAGVDWRQHRDTAFRAWLEVQRRALRGRLLVEEGVQRP